MRGFGTKTTRITMAGATLVALGVAGEAAAFTEVGRPWAVTPERALRTFREHPAGRASGVLDARALRTVSYRADGSPALIWATVTPAPSNIAPAQAEEQALAIARSIAPELGVLPDDLHVIGSTALEDWATVTLAQSFQGIDAYRGVMIFTFREGSLAAIRNDLVHHTLRAIEPEITPRDATSIALRSATTFAADSVIVRSAELEVWAPSDLPEDARLAYRVRTRSHEPRSELSFHVDAKDGSILAADDDVRFANGEGRVRITAETVSPNTTQVPFTGKFVGIGAGATDGDGDTLQTGSAQISYDGPYATISDQAGQAIETFNLTFNGPFQAYGVTPTLFSQADPFVHVNIAKSFARAITPTMAWLGQKVTINVNLNDNCNAFWDGTTLNFFRAGNGCNNTGRIASIVYHEFGHGYHQYLTQNLVGSVGEGTGDFLAALITGDPYVGRGIADNAAIRRLDQPKVYPTDVVGEVHTDGLVWATALWDLRNAMIAKHGDWAGNRITARVFVRALTQGPSLESAYPSVITGDDDDNNPANGTPNSCEINQIFGAHGLVNGGQLQNALAGTRAFVRINHEVPGRFVRQNGAVTIEATAENRSTCGTFSLADMKLSVAPGLEGGTFTVLPMQVSGNIARVTLPDLVEGDTFRYFLELQAGGATFRNGSSTSPHVGHVSAAGTTDIMREGFEAGFGAWKHGTIGQDRVDDWEAAQPHGLQLDPVAAKEGANVAGTDLGSGGGPSGTDGIAKPGRNTFLESPPIPTTGKENIRLELWQQYALTGALRVLVDGRLIWNITSDGSDWSQGWRFLSLPLGDAARDNAGVVVRLEIESAATNRLGGWSIDSFAVTGVAIPPPPPPPPPKDPPPVDNPPPGGPTGSTEPPSTGTNPNPGTTPGAAVNNPPQDGTDPARGDLRSPAGFDGGIRGGCMCVRGDPTVSAASFFVVLAGLILGRRKRRARSESDVSRAPCF